MRTTVALLGIAIVAVTIVFGAAVMVLRSDVQALQVQVGSPNPGTSQTITCSQLAKVRLVVHGRTAHCTAH